MIQPNVIFSVVAINVFFVDAYPVHRWVYTEEDGGTSYEFGFAFGRTFSNEIMTRLKEDPEMARLVSEFGVASGHPLYYYFLATHEQVFPSYMDELRGISVGSGIPFDTLFVAQLKQEFTYYLNETKTEINNILQKTDHCSDIILCQENGDIFIAHNEDASIYDINGTVLIEARRGVNGGPAFTALVYLGQTPTNAFGFNSNGVIFTMNKLPPKFADTQGLGRVFVARSLLDSTSFEDAVYKATKHVPMIAGHNYQIGLIHSDQVVNIEVASFGEYKITPFKAGDKAFYHANMYTELDVPQILPNPSSEHRIARYNEIISSYPVQTSEDMLNVLGDQVDNDYPIYHDTISHVNGDLSGYTLVTILINLQTCKISFYEDNPKFNNATFTLTIC